MNNSRRNFIKLNSYATIGVFLAPTALLSACKPKSTLNSKDADRKFKYYVDKDLKELRDWYSQELFDSFLPNMDKYVIDHKFGGFMCTVDIETGEQLATNKGVWYEGRGIWVYSFLYNNFKKDKHFLDIAKKSMSFILKNKPEKGEFWASSYTREGEMIKATNAANPWSSTGDIYGNLFVAEGLAEYAKATGEKQYYEQAKSILFDCIAIYDQPTYSFQLAYYSTEAPLIQGVRVLGHWMVLLRLATQMLGYQADPEVEKVADRCVDAIMSSHLNSNYNLLNEALNHDLSLPENEYNQMSYLGHAIETLWMVMDEAKRRDDNKLFQKTLGLFKQHVTLAQDNVYGGFFRSLDKVDNHIFKLNKVLWLQEEILIGTLFLVENTGDEWAYKCFSDTYKYVIEKFTRKGYKFWIHEGDRKMENIRMNRVEHYHHPRHLMLNLLALNRMTK